MEWYEKALHLIHQFLQVNKSYFPSFAGSILSAMANFPFFIRFAVLAVLYWARVHSRCSFSNSSSTDCASLYEHHSRLEWPKTQWHLPSGVEAVADHSCMQTGQQSVLLSEP